mmetsp:Transcript_36534/g.87127  ORF Transcript_36534/g.87127 Transcript_36534/m.87127 type:complete len:256 (+) Transcript_36534:6334-7101(+)
MAPCRPLSPCGTTSRYAPGGLPLSIPASRRATASGLPHTSESAMLVESIRTHRSADRTALGTDDSSEARTEDRVSKIRREKSSGAAASFATGAVAASAVGGPGGAVVYCSSRSFMARSATPSSPAVRHILQSASTVLPPLLLPRSSVPNWRKDEYARSPSPSQSTPSEHSRLAKTYAAVSDVNAAPSPRRPGLPCGGRGWGWGSCFPPCAAGGAGGRPPSGRLASAKKTIRASRSDDEEAHDSQSSVHCSDERVA